ncbi:tissue factor pathway inhibitor [Plakobranchus ocellatus]|uniref:Tissue factor pathway inhibitor n=1 Tax=Plakobranchus ocellatus TaxID=259542 RepID=A0AAV4CUG3_9GAST|nr:tissue factor pathway inhibitor [Plakobranchus ocellatus]
MIVREQEKEEKRHLSYLRSNLNGPLNSFDNCDGCVCFILLVFSKSSESVVSEPREDRQNTGDSRDTGNSEDTTDSDDTRSTVTESDDPIVVCQMQPEQGSCKANIERFYYDNTEGMCKSFQYGGCRGNSNNFASFEDCDYFCSAREVCSQPKKTGRCRAAVTRFYFDAATGTCKSFIYGGCDANLNNFQTKEACERRCELYLTSVDRSIPSGRTQNNGRESEEEVDLCGLLPDKGNCEGYNIKYYYNNALRRCVSFVYGGCQGNENRFDTIAECEQRCSETSESRRPTDNDRRREQRTTTTTTTTQAPQVLGRDTCNLDRDRGSCSNWTLVWYFDTENQYCRRFYYGGCGGNGNRFETEQECKALCTDVRVTTEAPQRETCYSSRYGCCDDGVTAAQDWRKSNCRGTDVVIPSNGDRGSNVMVRPGESTLLECSSRGREVMWYRDTFAVQNSRNFRIHSNGSLELRGVTEDMAGSYTCRVPQYNGGARLQRFTVSVNVPLTIIPGPSLVTVKPMGEAYMHCQASGEPSPRVSWSRSGRRIRNSRRHRVWRNGTLSVSAVGEDDVGSYLCTASNGVQSAVRKEFTLKMKESTDAHIHRHKGSYMEGDQIRLTCDGSGFPAPKIEWHRNGQPLITGGKIRVNGGQLTINSASIDDAGMYKCVVSNDRSSATDVTTIQIKFYSFATKCVDDMEARSCKLITTGNLCGFRMFAKRCCQSCRRAGSSVSEFLWRDRRPVASDYLEGQISFNSYNLHTILLVCVRRDMCSRICVCVPRYVCQDMCMCAEVPYQLTAAVPGYSSQIVVRIGSQKMLYPVECLGKDYCKREHGCEISNSKNEAIFEPRSFPVSPYYLIME